jgi:uncharacterized protein YkwD
MRVRTWMSAVVVANAMVGVLAHAQSPARAEKDLFAAVNQARHAQFLPSLRWDESLAAAARRHALVMAEHGAAQHAFDGEPGLLTRVKLAGAHFTWLSENVTQGQTAESIHAQFMKSPNHRTNILDSDMNSIGIGVVEQNGRLYAVEDFSQAH